MASITTYHTDYRSPPSGAGTILHNDGTSTLIQYKQCADHIEGVHDNIVYIPYDFSVNYKAANEALIKILKENNVIKVYDPELVNDIEIDEGITIDSKIIDLEQFIEFRRFYY